MDELNKVPDETHYSEADSDSPAYLAEFWSISLEYEIRKECEEALNLFGLVWCNE